MQFLAKIARHAWRAVWVLIGVQVLATAAGLGAVKVIPPVYRSTTRIRLEERQMQNPLVTRAPSRISETELRLRAIPGEIMARDYFEKVISRLGLSRPGSSRADREALIQKMMGSTEVSVRAREGSFEVSYSGGDPATVRDVTNVLAGTFIEDSLSSKTSEAGSEVEFLQGQLEVYRERLEQSEAALRRYEEEHVDQVPATRAAQLARVEQLRGTLSEVQNSLKQSRLQRDLLRQRLAGAPAPEAAGAVVAMVPNPLLVQVRQKEAELRRMLRDYSESYPDVAALRAEIAELQREVDAHPTVPADRAPATGANAVQDALAYGQLERLEVEVSSLTAREEQLQRELVRAEKRVRGIPEVEQEMTRLRRDYDVNNEIYNNFLRKLEEARVARDLETSQKGEVFRILQAAPLPLKPVFPTRAQTLLGGIALGLALNAGLVFLLAQNDTSFQSTAEVKSVLGLRVLTGVPRHRNSRESLAVRFRAVAVGLALSAYLAAVGGLFLWRRISGMLLGGE